VACPKPQHLALRHHFFFRKWGQVPEEFKQFQFRTCAIDGMFHRSRANALFSLVLSGVFLRVGLLLRSSLLKTKRPSMGPDRCINWASKLASLCNLWCNNLAVN